MGMSVTFYIGPYVEILAPVKVIESVESRICPSCNTKRDGLFCETCGTEIITKTKNKERKIKQAPEIIEHFGYDWDAFDTVFSYFNYSDLGGDFLIANYNSKYLRNWDRGDLGRVITIEEMRENTLPAVGEMLDKGKAFFELLSRHEIKYEVRYGALLGGY